MYDECVCVCVCRCVCSFTIPLKDDAFQELHVWNVYMYMHTLVKLMKISLHIPHAFTCQYKIMYISAYYTFVMQLIFIINNKSIIRDHLKVCWWDSRPLSPVWMSTLVTPTWQPDRQSLPSKWWRYVILQRPTPYMDTKLLCSVSNLIPKGNYWYMTWILVALCSTWCYG